MIWPSMRRPIGVKRILVFVFVLGFFFVLFGITILLALGSSFRGDFVLSMVALAMLGAIALGLRIVFKAAVQLRRQKHGER